MVGCGSDRAKGRIQDVGERVKEKGGVFLDWYFLEGVNGEGDRGKGSGAKGFRGKEQGLNGIYTWLVCLLGSIFLFGVVFFLLRLHV